MRDSCQKANGADLEREVQLLDCVVECVVQTGEHAGVCRVRLIGLRFPPLCNGKCDAAKNLVRKRVHFSLTFWAVHKRNAFFASLWNRVQKM